MDGGSHDGESLEDSFSKSNVGKQYSYKTNYNVTTSTMGSCCSTTPYTDSERMALVKHSKQTGHLRSNLVQASHTDPLESYTITKRLGVGSMGYVNLVQKRKSSQGDKDQYYAMKTLRLGRMSARFVRELRNEIAIVRDLDHPGIVKFYHVYYAPKQIFVVMEYCSGGDLYQRMPYSEQVAADILLQVLSAVAYMHSRGYVHRDLKFENIMFETKSSDFVKIIDFGLSTRYNPEHPLRAQLGTILTMAPEVFKGNYDSQCDTWSIGVVAFELLSSTKPFSSPSIVGLMTQISAADYSFDKSNGWKHISSQAKNFCASLLQKDPSRRLTAASALQHPWLTSQKQKASGSGNSVASIESDDGAVQNLTNFTKLPPIAKIVLLLIAHNTFPQEVSELRSRFEAMDTDQTGVISFQEFKTAFQRCFENDEDKLQEIFDGMDVSGDGYIAYTEFLSAAVGDHIYLTEEKLAEAFDALDEDNSGKVSVENLTALLGQDSMELKTKEFLLTSLKQYSEGMTFEELMELFRQHADKMDKLLLPQKVVQEQCSV